MKLLETSHGFVFSFGFDVLLRVPDPRVVMWCDPSRHEEWSPTVANLAGSVRFACDVRPQFVKEASPTVIVAYQPGMMLEFVFVGRSPVWSCHIMRPDETTTWLNRDG